MTEPGPDETVASLRRRMRTLRRAVDPAMRREASSAAMHRVATLPWWPTAARIGLYRPFDGELDPGSLASLARRRGASGAMTLYVPVLDGDRLVFAEADEADRWEPNRYGIAEPVGTGRVDALSLDLVLVPAVAVDRRGNRLGMGAGWYDRTFAQLVHAARPASVALVAAVLDEQVIDTLHPSPWDVRVDAVVTPTRTFLTSG